MNGIFKMTESSANALSPSTTLTGDDLENDIIEVPPPMDIQAQPKLSADADKVTTDESTSLVSHSSSLGNSRSVSLIRLRARAWHKPAFLFRPDGFVRS